MKNSKGKRRRLSVRREEEEKVISIQVSGKETGESDLIEEILEKYQPIIARLARESSVAACRLEPEDVEQQLRIRLYHAIEFWPRRGSFERYALRTLRNAQRNCIQGAHRGSFRIRYFSVPLEEYKDLTIDPISDLDGYLSANLILERLCDGLRRRGKIQLVKAIKLLLRGHSEQFISLLLGIESGHLMKELRHWAEVIRSEDGLEL